VEARTAGRLQRVPARGGALLAEPERLHRARSGRGRREDLRDVRGGRALGEIPVPGPPQVPAQRQPDRRQAEHADGTEQRVQQEHRADQEQTLHEVDEQFRTGVPQRVAHGRDVRGAAGRQVAGAGAFHDRGGQVEGAVHEPFPYACEGAFAEAVAYVAGPAGEEQLGEGAGQEHEGQPVHGRHAVSGADVVDHPAQQPGPCQTGQGGEGVEAEDGGEGSGVGPYEVQQRPADVRPFGNRQVSAAHRTASSVSLATRAR
jgi:hypothetical protein